MDSKLLNCRSDKFTIVLNDNELHLFKSASNIIKEINCIQSLCLIFGACILHDKDYDKDAKKYKTPHYHLVMFVDKNYRLGTVLHLLSDTFKCNENQITIDKCNDLCAQTRYLIHEDEYEEEKYHYDRCDIATNKYDTLYRYLDIKRIADLKDCVEVVRQYHYDLEEIMMNISNYDKWRKYINDLVVNYHRKRF